MVKPRRIPHFDISNSIVKVENELPLIFGKYRGETPLAIAEKDPGYIVWVAETFHPREIPFTQDLYELCKLTQEQKREEAEDDPSLKELDGHLNFRK